MPEKENFYNTHDFLGAAQESTIKYSPEFLEQLKKNEQKAYNSIPTGVVNRSDEIKCIVHYDDNFPARIQDLEKALEIINRTLKYHNETLVHLLNLLVLLLEKETKKAT